MRASILTKPDLALFVLLGSLALLATGSSTHAQIPCRYEVTVVPEYDCGFWQGAPALTAINNHGHVVGWFDQCGCCGPESFIWTGGKTLTVIQRPPWMHSFLASDISDDGLIVGTAEADWAGQRGYIYNTNTGEWTELVPQAGGGPDWSGASAINPSGIVGGYRCVNDGGDPVNPYVGFLWHPKSGFTDLEMINGGSSGVFALNDAGVATGSIQTQEYGTQYAFILENGRLTILPTLGGDSGGLAVNNFNVVAGGSQIPSPNYPFVETHPALWIDGEIVQLPKLPGHNIAQVQDITDDGLCIGFSRRVTQSGQGDEVFGVLWYDGQIIKIQDLLDPALEMSITSAGSFNAAGLATARGGSARLGAVTVILTPAGRSPADINYDCSVNVADLLLVVSHWGQTESVADLNDDGIVNVHDLLIVISQWTA